MIKLTIIAMFLVYGLDEYGFINADDFDVVPEAAVETPTQAAEKPTYTKFTDRVAYRNQARN